MTILPNNEIKKSILFKQFYLQSTIGTNITQSMPMIDK